MSINIPSSLFRIGSFNFKAVDWAVDVRLCGEKQSQMWAKMCLQEQHTEHLLDFNHLLFLSVCLFPSLVTQQLPKTESFFPNFFCPCGKWSHNTETSVPETFVIFITYLINISFESGDLRNSCQVFVGLRNGKWKTGQINIKWVSTILLNSSNLFACLLSQLLCLNVLHLVT